VKFLLHFQFPDFQPKQHTNFNPPNPIPSGLLQLQNQNVPHTNLVVTPAGFPSLLAVVFLLVGTGLSSVESITLIKRQKKLNVYIFWRKNLSGIFGAVQLYMDFLITFL